MSRSTQPYKGFFSDGWHLVAIMEAKQQAGGILITFADGNNNKRQELFKMDKYFIKMCGDARLITDESVFDSEKAIGARLMIEIVEGVLADTKEYNEHENPLVNLVRKTVSKDQIKAKIIAEQREMINKVQSGAKDEFDM